MIVHRVYQCPKCFNTLLVSNKMLHDLRCTVENPATYENILFRQSQLMERDPTYYNNYNNSNSSQRFSTRSSVKNDDGTMTDIVKEKNMRGKEEYIEIKYDPQGNIISRKRADQSINYIEPKNSFHELSEYNEYDNNYETSYDNNNNTYYEMNNEVEVKNEPNVIIERGEAREIIYQAPVQYDPHIIIHKPIEETVIDNEGGISDDIMDSILRHTMTMPMANNTNNNYNVENYGISQNYSQMGNINTNSYTQSYDMNSFNNQYNLGNNNIYNNSIQMNNNGITNATGNLNYNSNHYQY